MKPPPIFSLGNNFYNTLRSSRDDIVHQYVLVDGERGFDAAKRPAVPRRRWVEVGSGGVDSGGVHFVAVEGHEIAK